jgi:hypothetical protein
MTTIYPINPSAGGGPPPPVFNGSNNGLVPNPGAGLPGRVLTAAGTWSLPPGVTTTTIVMNPSVTTGSLGGVNWTSTWADPINLASSTVMSVARMNSNIYSNSLGQNGFDVILSSGAGQMITRNNWGTNLGSINFGLYSLAWNCDFYGTIFTNGVWFQISGGAARNANNSDLLITKLT